MKILMLGNSLTTSNDMPQRLAELHDSERCAVRDGCVRGANNHEMTMENKKVQNSY